MKKIKVILSIAVLALSASLTSCSKSNEALLNDYQDLCNELVEAVKSGDEAKAQEISEKGEKLAKELEGRDLTDEEKQQLVKITQEAGAAAMGAAFQNIPGFGE